MKDEEGWEDIEDEKHLEEGDHDMIMRMILEKASDLINISFIFVIKLSPMYIEGLVEE